MRKDTRIGVAIGLVLFAVLIVYAVVGSKTGNKKKVTLDTTGKNAASAEDSSARGGALLGSASGELKETGAGETPAPLVATETSDPSAHANNGANWAALLGATEKLDSIRTTTPGIDRTSVVDTRGTAGSSPKGTVGAETAAKPGATGGADSGGKTRVPSRDTALVASHRIEQDETFVSIARAVYGDGRYADAIQKANPNVNPRRLRLGTTILLPDKAQVLSGTSTPAAAGTSHVTPSAKTTATVAGKEYTIQADDNLYKISVKLFGKADKVDAIYELNKQQIGPDPAKLRPGMVLKLPQNAPPLSTASAVH